VLLAHLSLRIAWEPHQREKCRMLGSQKTETLPLNSEVLVGVSVLDCSLGANLFPMFRSLVRTNLRIAAWGRSLIRVCPMLGTILSYSGWVNRLIYGQGALVLRKDTWV
jgi:hypothetical protein